MAEKVATIRRRYAAKIARMTPEEASTALAAIRAAGATIHQPTIRALTGGYVGQSLNHAVVRKLAERAGMFKGLH